MAAGRFRKARDAYKILCKLDHEKNLPGLVEANRCLAGQLLEQGLISEAEQVLAHLKTIGKPSSLQTIDIFFALKKLDWQTAFDETLGLLRRRPLLDQERDRAAVADALVLAFPDHQEAVQFPFPGASDLAAVLEALRCVSEERWDQALEKLRPVPRSSLFAGWKIMIKTLIAFYTGDKKKVEALLTQLPPHGVPMRAAQALRSFLGSQQLEGPAREQSVRGACSLLKATELATFVLRADRSWNSARHLDSYKEMREAPGFPSSGQTDLAGALSDFYFKAPFLLRESVLAKYLDWFQRLDDSGQFKNDQEAQLTYRMLGCAALNNPLLGGEIEHFWRMFLQSWPANDPLSGKAASLVLGEVGNYYAEIEKLTPFFIGEEGDTEDAVRLLDESIERDPSNLSAYRSLLKLFQSSNFDKERAELLDRMAQLFPGEKSVLLDAARNSLKQKNSSKGIQLLERAQSLDPLDTEVLQMLVSAYARLAQQEYERKQLKKGRNTFELAKRHATRERGNYVRGLDFLQALQGVLETNYGDNHMGQRLLAAAREQTPSVAALLFFAHGTTRLIRPKSGTAFWTELSQSRDQVDTAAVRKELYLVFEHLFSQNKSLDWSKEYAFLRKRLSPLASAAFTREEAAYFVPLIAPHPPLASLARAITAQALRRNPDDPRFRLYRLLARTPSPEDFNLWELEAIYNAAIRLKDKETAKLAKAAMDASKDPSGQLMEDDFVMPEQEIAQMKAMAAKMSDAEFEKFREESAKFIPFSIFDQMMAGARGKTSQQSQPRQRRGTDQGKDQLDLF